MTVQALRFFFTSKLESKFAYSRLEYHEYLVVDVLPEVKRDELEGCEQRPSVGIEVGVTEIRILPDPWKTGVAIGTSPAKTHTLFKLYTLHDKPDTNYRVSLLIFCKIYVLLLQKKNTM